MASFSGTRAPTSRKYVVEQGSPPSNLSKTFQTFWSHTSILLLEKQPEKLNFQSFLPVRNPLVASFHETRTPVSRKYVFEQRLPTPN